MLRVVEAWLAAAAVSVAVAAPVMAAPLAAYGDLPTVGQIAISPNGRLLALDVEKGNDHNIVVQDLTAKKIVTGLKLGEADVRYLTWAGNDHLIISTSKVASVAGLLGADREWLTATDFNVVTNKARPLLGEVDNAMNVMFGGPVNRVVGGKPIVFVAGVYFPMEKAATTTSDEVHGQAALFKIDLDSGRSSLVSKGEEHSQEFVVSDVGQPALEETYDPVTQRWALKLFSGGVWRQIQSGVGESERPAVYGLGRDGRSFLVVQLVGDDYVARELTPDGASFSEPLSKGIASGALEDATTHRLIGFRERDGDRFRYVFFDDNDQLKWKAIQAAFPGDEIELRSWSDDRKKVVVRVLSSSGGPGFALVDLSEASLIWLGADYPSLASADISPTKPIAFKAADGLELTGRLTLPAGRTPTRLPLIVYPNSLPIEPSDPEFNWWAQAMASRGYAVLRVDQRGSGGRGWRLQSAGFGEWARKMQSDLSDGVSYLAAQGSIDPTRVCILGMNYGGYAALAGAARQPPAYRCAIDLGGPSDMPKFIAVKAKLGGAALEQFWNRYVGAAPADDAGLDAISPADHADKVSIPILIIQGKDDTVVPFEQSQIMADALKKAGKPYDFVILNHEDHWLSRSDTRLQMLQATMDFLAKHNPAGQ